MESYAKGWINVNLMINPRTGEIHAIGGDREPCAHHETNPCCDTAYIGLELIKDWIKNGNVRQCQV